MKNNSKALKRQGQKSFPPAACSSDMTNKSPSHHQSPGIKCKTHTIDSDAFVPEEKQGVDVETGLCHVCREHTSTHRRGKPMGTRVLATYTHIYYKHRYKKRITAITHLCVKSENLLHVRLSPAQNVRVFDLFVIIRLCLCCSGWLAYFLNVYLYIFVAQCSSL